MFEGEMAVQAGDRIVWGRAQRGDAAQRLPKPATVEPAQVWPSRAAWL